MSMPRQWNSQQHALLPCVAREYAVPCLARFSLQFMASDEMNVATFNEADEINKGCGLEAI